MSKTNRSEPRVTNLSVHRLERRHTFTWKGEVMTETDDCTFHVQSDGIVYILGNRGGDLTEQYDATKEEARAHYAELLKAGFRKVA